jgi:hypothetical protein
MSTQQCVRNVLISAFISFLFLPSTPLFAAATRGINVTVRITEGHKIELYKDSYAFVIGNGNYQNGWDKIPGSIRDVKEVAAVLEKQGFKVTLLTDLTRDQFVREFKNFSAKYGKTSDNRILFYYAGHGYTEKTVTDEEIGYIVMVDATVPEKDEAGFALGSIDMQSLIAQAKVIKAKHVLFIFDSCFSGTILNVRDRVVPQAVSENIKYPVRQFITAGSANESVPDHSVFKQAFLDILEGRDKKPLPGPYLTGEELALYLKNKVPEYNPLQHPQYGKIKDPKLDKGDFIFVLESSSKVTNDEDTEKVWVQEEKERLRREKELLAQRRIIDEETRKIAEEWKKLDQQDIKEEKTRLVEERKKIDEERKTLASRKLLLESEKTTTTLKILDEQPSDTATPVIKTGVKKHLPPQSESSKKIAYIPKDNISERKVISLRSKPDENFSPSHYQTVLNQYNFFDNMLNKNGSFQNDFVDNSDDTITDRSTGLMWQKSGSSRDLYLIETANYIEKLNLDAFAGYSDWRIPTTDEIVSLMKQTKKKWGDLHVDSMFDKTQYACWSSDVGIFNISTGHYNAWFVSFEEGTAQQVVTRNSVQSGTGAFQNPEWRSFSRYVRAVRSLKQSNQ